MNRYWSKRLLESREIVAEQLKGLSGVLSGLSNEVELDLETSELAPVLRRKLKEAGVHVEQLSVVARQGLGSEVFLMHTPCGGQLRCANTVAPLLSTLLEVPIYPATPHCTLQEGNEACSLRFYPELKCCLELGIASCGKQGSLISGDSYACFHLRGGRLALVLSDGMGAGPQASLESRITISLLGRLLDAGFDQDLAIKTVNSLLVLRSPGETFATVDLAVINLYTGKVDFVKIGAMPTLIMRGHEIRLVKAGSLPVGIVEDIEVASMSKKIQPGDILVMVTDGLLEAYRGQEEPEDWLSGILLEVSHMPAQAMAELILKLVQTGAGGVARVPDDVTVLVARLKPTIKVH